MPIVVMVFGVIVMLNGGPFVRFFFLRVHEVCFSGSKTIGQDIREI